MNETDRELLELAAKAAGLGQTIAVFGVPPFMGLRLQGGQLWNPLTDNGQAFELAVKMRIDVIHTHIHSPQVHAMADEKVQVWEDCSSDPITATCRAIVRAAAEIGRNMK